MDIFSSQINQEGAKTKQARDILTAILTIVTTHYNAHHHYVSKIFTDSETVLKSLRAQLGIFGITLQLATPGDHARRFERHNQTLTSKSRATRASLPYILPKKYNLQLDADTMHKTNIIPNKSFPTKSPYQQVTNSLPPAPVGLFGHVYMVKLHDDQRTLISSKQHIPMKDTDKGTIAVHMGQNPLYPGAPQVLLPNGVITARHLQSTALPIIPFGWTPKPRTHQPILPHQPTTPTSGPVIELSATRPTPATLPTQHPTTNQPVQSTQLDRLQTTIFNHTPPKNNPISTPIVLPPPPEDIPSPPSDPIPTPIVLPHPPEDIPTPPSTVHTAVQPPAQPPVQPPAQSSTITTQSPSVEKYQETTTKSDHLPPTQPTTTRTTRHKPSPPGFYDQLTGNVHHTRRPPPQPVNQLQRATNFLSALITKPINAVQRKSILKQATMSIARQHLQTVTPLAPTTNKPVLTQPTMQAEYYELHPPPHTPDEIPLTQALALIRSQNTPPALVQKLTDAVAKEMTKVTTQFDTLREITAENPMEPDAIKLNSLMFIKFKHDGRVTARLAGNGAQQRSDSYSDTFASTSDHGIFSLTTAAYYADATLNNTVDSLHHCDFDFEGAFLQQRLPRSATGGKQVVLKLPHNLPHRLAGKWVEVVGCLYGLKQSNHLFEEGLKEILATIHFLPTHDPLYPYLPLEPSVYHYTNPTDPTKKCTLLMHVDDGQVLSTDHTIVQLLKATLTKRYGQLVWHDQTTKHTGTNITRYPNGAIKFDLSDHILRLLTKTGMDDIPGSLTPSSTTLFQPSLDTTPTDKRQYQSIVGDLNYIARVRHEVVKEIQHHARQCSSPTVGDLLKVIRTLRYLKSFHTLGPVYYTTEGPLLCGHVDTSHANQPDGTSTTGLTATIGSTSAPVYSKSLPQTIPALAPAHAEYMSLTTIAKVIMRYRYYLASIGFPQLQPTPIYHDNLPAIHLAQAPAIPPQSRYIHAQFHFINYLIKHHQIVLIQRNTNQLPPDLLTKSQGPTVHHYLTKLILNTDSLPPQPL